MKEVWKDIKGYEGLYQVSNFGNVKSLTRYKSNGSGLMLIEERILKNTKTRNGYFSVGLCKDNSQKKHYIHRLVAQAFIENPKNYPIINHKDQNKENNNVLNLEWCTHSYNNKYSDITSKPKKEVMLMKEDGTIIDIYESCCEASRKTGCNYATIARCAREKRRAYNGYIWRFKNE